MYCDIETLREEMNKAGRERRPFLFVTDYNLRRGYFSVNPKEECTIKWHISGMGGNDAGLETDKDVWLERVCAPTAKEYECAFDKVQAGLQRGDSFLANLTFATKVECPPLHDVYAVAKAPYKLLIPGEFVCFSPESFVKISEEGVISTYPMKGTIKADKEDSRERLEKDIKELSEHYTIVDLLRNDLGMVSDDVRVSRFRYFELVDTVSGPIYQTSSQIDGRLPGDWQGRLGDIMIALLPAGSICGAPKEATVRLIEAAESVERGWYTGVFGVYDGHKLDSGVMIRCIQRHEDGAMYFHSGGGITVNSKAESEYAELLAKVYLTKG